MTDQVITAEHLRRAEEKFESLLAAHEDTQKALRNMQQHAAALEEQLRQREMQINQALEAAQHATGIASAAVQQNANLAASASAGSSAKPNKPTSYDGKRTAEAVQAFTNGIKKYFSKAPVAEQLEYFSTYLTDEALNWWLNFERNQTAQQKAAWTLESVLQALSDEFRPRMTRQQARQKLKKMKMGRQTFKQYYDSFTATLLLAGDVSPDEKLDWFLDGLTENFSNAIALKADNADTLTYEQAVKAAENWDSLRSRRKNATESSEVPADDPMELGMMHQKHQKHQKKPNQKGKPKSDRVKLSPEEKAALRAENKCFICKQTGHMAKDCPQNDNNKGSKGQNFQKQ